MDDLSVLYENVLAEIRAAALADALAAEPVPIARWLDDAASPRRTPPSSASPRTRCPSA